MDNDEPKPGYKNPPKSTQFKKGQSGNPKGRAPGRHKQAPYEKILGQDVSINLHGKVQIVTAAEAFLLKMCKESMDGNGAQARILEEAFTEEERRRDEKNKLDTMPEFYIAVIRLGTLGPVLEPLRLATKKKRYSHDAHYLLEPWIVKTALERLERQLSVEEQRTVVSTTNSPNKIKWPDWWEEMP